MNKINKSTYPIIYKQGNRFVQHPHDTSVLIPILLQGDKVFIEISPYNVITAVDTYKGRTSTLEC